MSESQNFAEFISRIRAGDTSAAEQLVREYEPLIRREVRMKMIDSRVNRVYDSIDFSQAVMASFFLRAQQGEFELRDPRDLVRLLVTMAKNKIASGARRLLSEKRDGQRDEYSPPMFEQVPDVTDTPSRVVELVDLIQEAKRRLTEEESQLAEYRHQGKSWEEIAELMQSSPSACRMKLVRAFDRVTQELGIGDE